LTEQFKQEICAAFEGVVVEVLTKKLITAAVKYQCTSVALAGWVSANDTLCSSIQSAALQRKWQYIFPVKKQYSMDNAAMIGILGWYTFLEGEK
jgi:N6-L-threonylcarbamoyladenine synthase